MIMFYVYKAEDRKSLKLRQTLSFCTMMGLILIVTLTTKY